MYCYNTAATQTAGCGLCFQGIQQRPRQPPGFPTLPQDKLSRKMCPLGRSMVNILCVTLLVFTVLAGAAAEPTGSSSDATSRPMTHSARSIFNAARHSDEVKHRSAFSSVSVPTTRSSSDHDSNSPTQEPPAESEAVLKGETVEQPAPSRMFRGFGKAIHRSGTVGSTSGSSGVDTSKTTSTTGHSGQPRSAAGAKLDPFCLQSKVKLTVHRSQGRSQR